MKSKIGKELRKYFIRSMNSRFPFFELISDKEIISQGNQLYRWKINEKFYCFILLQVHKIEDHFTLHIASSQDPNWGTSKTDISLVSESAYIRINRLWNNTEDFWFMLPEEKKYQIQKKLNLETQLKMEREGHFLSKEEMQNEINKQWKERIARESRPVTEEEISGFYKIVDEAIELIIKYAIPYFQKYITVQAMLVSLNDVENYDVESMER